MLRALPLIPTVVAQQYRAKLAIIYKFEGACLGKFLTGSPYHRFWSPRCLHQVAEGNSFLVREKRLDLDLQTRSFLRFEGKSEKICEPIAIEPFIGLVVSHDTRCQINKARNHS